MPEVTPFLWFTGDAEEAVNFYVSVFPNSRVTNLTRYSEGGPGPAGEVMTMEFELDGKPLMAINSRPMESPPSDELDFRQGKIALYVDCATQEIVDDLWVKLGEGGRELPCGWVQDRYGFAWNIVPTGLREILSGPDEDRSQRAMDAMLQMGKLDINELRRVYAS
jgi:predicted 3-demethylubiquinone-9 3-methyltransferase (glyoxalase superfamily)